MSKTPLPLWFSYTTQEWKSSLPPFKETPPPLIASSWSCTYGYAEEALAGVAMFYRSLWCGTANTKHLRKEMNVSRAGSRLPLEVGRPSVQQ